MDKDLYCSMIHGGLHIVAIGNKCHVQHCCIRGTNFETDVNTNFWHDSKFIPLRKLNLENKWDKDCDNCRLLEKTSLTSFRTGMNEGLGIYPKTDLPGPARIDLLFDISCNLACRTCSADSSTYWQKHLKEHNLWNQPIFSPRNKTEIIEMLKKLDLSCLRMIVFCGGETLLGQEYWDVAEWLANNVPNAKDQLTLCFQTNGTQSILEKNYKTIDKVKLVKLHFSLDGIEEQFEYLRWPASWQQVTQNMFDLRENLPGNVLFLVEETISIFNLAYLDKLEHWISKNFATNREGDIVNHTRHLANGIFGLHNLSKHYVQAISNTKYSNLLPSVKTENLHQIKTMLADIDKFDQFRKQSFKQTFPEVAEYYSKFN